MKKTIAIIAALTVGLASCGGGDDAAPATTTAGASVTDGSEARTDATDPDTSASTVAASPETTVAAPSTAATGGPGEVDSIHDMPPECVELFTEFLKRIEPALENIDWENATLADLQAVGTGIDDFEDDFDERAEELDCPDLSDDPAAMDEMIALAHVVAPGTVGFFEFLKQFMVLDTDGTLPSDGAALETCDDAIALIEGWMARYDSARDVPLAEIARWAEIATVMGTCTIDQLRFFDRDDVDAFMDSLGE